MVMVRAAAEQQAGRLGGLAAWRARASVPFTVHGRRERDTSDTRDTIMHATGEHTLREARGEASFVFIGSGGSGVV